MSKPKLIEVKKLYFDTEAKQPVLALKDGTLRVVMLMPTGNCWVEYWVTPEYKAKSEKEAIERDKKRQEEARQYFVKVKQKKPWWRFWS